MHNLQVIRSGYIPVGGLCFCVGEEGDSLLYAGNLYMTITGAKEAFKQMLGEDAIIFAWNVYQEQMGGTGEAVEFGGVDEIVGRFEIIPLGGEGFLGINVLEFISFQEIQSQGGVYGRLGSLGHPIQVLRPTTPTA